MRSMCPQIRGLAAVKLATLLMLIGGLERKDEGGMHIRGEIHMLLVGDPGTGVAACQQPRRPCMLLRLQFPQAAVSMR